MADNEQRTPGRRYQGLRIAGVNSPGVPELSGLSRQAVPEQVDITTEKFSQMGEDVQRGYQVALDTLRARGQAKAAELEAQGRSPRQSALAGLAQTAIEAFGKVQEDAAKRKAEEKKYAQQVGEMHGYELLETTLADLESGIIQEGDIEGINTLEADARRIIREVTVGLPPTVRQEMNRFVFEKVESARQRTNTRIYEAQRETRTAQVAAKKAEVTAHVMGIASALSIAPTPERQNELLNQMFSEIGRHTEGMDVLSRLEIMTGVVDTVLDDVEEGTDLRATLELRQTGMLKLQEELPAMRARYAGDENGFRIAVQALADRYQITDLAGAVSTQEELGRVSRRDAQDEAAYRENLLRQQETDFARAYPDFNNQMAQVMAWDMYNGGNEGLQRVSEIRAKGDAASPAERTALRIYESYEDAAKSYRESTQQLAQINEHVASITRQRDPNSLGNTRAQWDAIEREWVRMPVSELLNTPAAISSAGGVAGFGAAIQQYLGGRTQTVDGQEVLYVTPGVSAEELAAAVARRQLLENQTQADLARFRSQGFDPVNPTNTQYIDPVRAEYRSGLQQMREIRATGQSVIPNFETGGVSAPATPPVQPLAQVNGHLSPFPATANVTITDRYERHNHPTRGRPHHGIDIVGSGRGGDNVLSVQGGLVIRASEWSTYGGTVLVRTPDGRIEQFSHLRQFNVREGQTIPPGFQVGLMGGGAQDPMKGSSRGRHVHFQVWKPDPDYGSPTRDTLPPVDYLASVTYNQREPRGVGLPPTQANATGGSTPITNDQTSTGNYQVPITPGNAPYLYDPDTRQAVTTRQVFTESNPRRTPQAPINRSAYPRTNNPSHNYGYAAIARDPDFSRALADLGNYLDIPAQWLADVMAYEVGTDFNPRRAGGDRNRYHGLIQISEANLRNMGLSVWDLRYMTRADYVRRVARPYFEEFKGRIHTIEDLYAAILGGTRLFNKTPEQRRNIGDSNNTFGNHIRRIGAPVGRSYRTSYDGQLTSSLPVHTHLTPGCPICTNQTQNNSFITPHQGVA